MARTPIRTFTATTGRTFAVRFLPAGARYGRSRSYVADLPMVEFYDATYADDHIPEADRDGFGPLGQFVAAYDADELLGRDRFGARAGGWCLHDGHRLGSGLCLYGGEPAWNIDGPTMDGIRAWLAATLDQRAPHAAA